MLEKWLFLCLIQISFHCALTHDVHIYILPQNKSFDQSVAVHNYNALRLKIYLQNLISASVMWCNLK